MTDHLNLRPHKVTRQDRPDGSILLTSEYPLPETVRVTGDWLEYWAAKTPDAVFLAERSGEGWRSETYAAVLSKVRAIAGALLRRGMGQDAPLLILSGNGVDHALMMLGAMHVGVPVVPVAEQYSLIPAAHPRLQHAARLVQPGMVFAADGEAYGAALALPELEGLDTVCSDPGSSAATALSELLSGTDDGVDAAFAALTPDTVCKYLLTSGSTSDPKAVITTQRMLTTNQAQIAAGLPFVTARPPILVDWLPWNHTFGGSHNFNLVLANGGSLYIDDGKPLPALFPRTVENLGLVSGTISFNVPVGFGQLVTALRDDPALRDTYFRNLDMIFYAGASLPQETWSALEDLAREAGAKMPLITSSWGLTETAPAAMQGHEPAKGAGIVGVPLPGVEVKLVPEEEDGDRFDVRVRGDSITPGYLNNPEKTREAFDEEGFFITGDAMKFVDPGDPARGLRFDGRLSEDFKLQTGTWVRAANLRLEMLPLLAPFAQDLAVVGAGRDEVGVLIFPNAAALERAGHTLADANGAGLCADLHSEISTRLARAASGATGSATRVTRALFLTEPPQMGEGEITAKGNLNFAKLLARRAALVDRLYDDEDPAVIRAEGTA